MRSGLYCTASIVSVSSMSNLSDSTAEMRPVVLIRALCELCVGFKIDISQFFRFEMDCQDSRRDSPETVAHSMVVASVEDRLQYPKSLVVELRVPIGPVAALLFL